MTIHEIDPGVDSGPVVAQLKYSIYPETESRGRCCRSCAYGWVLFDRTMPRAVILGDKMRRTRPRSRCGRRATWRAEELSRRASRRADEFEGIPPKGNPWVGFLSWSDELDAADVIEGKKRAGKAGCTAALRVEAGAEGVWRSTWAKAHAEPLLGSAFERRLIGSVNDRTRSILDQRSSTRPYKRRGWLVRRTLLVADIVGLSLAFLVAEALAGESGLLGGGLSVGGETLLFLISLPFWVILAKLHGLYEGDEERADHSTTEDVVGVLHLTTTGLWVIALPLWALGIAEPTFRRLALFLIPAVVLVTVARCVARSLSRRNIAYLQNTVIVGAGDVGQLVARKIRQHPEYGLDLVGFVDAEPREQRVETRGVDVLGGLERSTRHSCASSTSTVSSSRSRTSPTRETMDVVRVAARPRRASSTSCRGCSSSSGPRVERPRRSRACRSSASRPRGCRARRSSIKRAIDIVGAALVPRRSPRRSSRTSALRIKLDSPGPVLFRQTRLGLDMRALHASSSSGRCASTRIDEEHRDVHRSRSRRSTATLGRERALQARARRTP